MNYKNLLVDNLYLLFNGILNSGFFPVSWCEAILIPVHKKGEHSDPNNYRENKLFTFIQSRRLLKWSAVNDVLTDAQFGFKPGFETTDAIFVWRF